MDWETCKSSRFAKQITPDTELIKSLKESSEKRLKSAQLLPLNEITKESIIILLYDGLRELLEALAIKTGFKIYNHECYTSFLLAVIKTSDLARKFDALRKLRNGMNYYGQQISLADAETVIKDAKELIEKVDILLSK